MWKKYSRYSILLSIVSLSLTVFINIKIAEEYLRVDRKTQALFGIKEQFQFTYQYYVAFIGIAALIFTLLSLRSGIVKPTFVVAIIMSAIAIALVFMRIWRLFV